MKKFALTAAALAASIRLALAADPAALSIVVFDDGQPVPRTEVLIDGRAQGVTDDYGSLRVTVPAGSRELKLRADGREVLSLSLDFAEGENAELIASLQPDGPARVQYESSEAGRPAQVQTEAPAAAGPPGTIAGRVVDSETGQPVANARVFISGTPLDVRTDADGRFSAEVPVGTYSISVIAAEFDSRSFEGVQVAAGETLSREIELTPAGLELPEFVVLEPYVEGSLTSLVEERRDSASVADFLGAEQISRAGDSDAAGALKRVTGLTLVDGKYIYVRGLGERYSSVLLNGAMIPSPDPTRRVVPLDLFPTEVIESVLVQKTYSSDMPGEFGGGTIALRTRNAPDNFFAKLGVTVGYADGTTGERGLTYSGGSRDWTGYDSGARDVHGELSDAIQTGNRVVQGSNFTPAQIEAIGEALATHSSYTPFEKRIEPEYGLTAGVGDSWQMGDVKFGLLSAVRYNNSWDVRSEARRTYVGSTLTPNDRFEVDTTTQEINLSGFLNASAAIGENHLLRGNLLLARVTEDETQIQEGISDSQELRRYKLEWVENQLRSGQIGGEHTFPFLAGLQARWLYGQYQASRYAPNRRTYTYRRDAEDRLAFQTGSLVQSFGDLVDDADGYDVELKLPWTMFRDRLHASVAVGVSDFSRDRDNSLRAFGFQNFNNISSALLLRPLEDILAAQNIGPNGVRMQESTQPTENYTASQQLDGEYLALDVEWQERYRLAAGVRREHNKQQLSPAPIGSGTVPPEQFVDIDERANLPFAVATWKYSPDSQFRLGYSKTLSRPDFRELSRSPYTDAQLDLLFFGNPLLKSTSIRNYDLRWEYYFSPSESFAAALFRKDFIDPIEKSQQPGGSGAQGELINADSATLDGIEFDIYKQLDFVERWAWTDRLRLGWVDWENVYVSANYARIRSSIDLDLERCGDTGFLTSCERPLQGQSPYVVNLQVGYLNPDAGREYSLLFNRFGARISQIGVDGAPDIYEQPFNQLDLVFQQKFWNDWSFKVRLRNLLDPEVRYLQGGQPTRLYKKGREVLFTVEWKP